MKKIVRIIIPLVLFSLNLFAQPKSEIPTLLPNQTLERQMSGAETHRYQINLKKDEFLQIKVEQKGVDVMLRLLDEKNNLLATMDSPNGKEGWENLSFVATNSAIYILEIRSLDEKAEKGFYTLQSEQRHPATQTDKKRIEADHIFEEADTLFRQQTVETAKKALEKFQEAVQLYEEIDDKSANRGLSLLGLGTISSNLGMKSNAIKFYQKAIIFYQLTKNKSGEAMSLNNIGKIYAELGEKQKALELYQKALSLSKEAGDKYTEANALTELGSIYSILGEKRKALEYYQKALNFYQSIGDKKSEAYIIIYLGTIYANLGENKKASEFYKKALHLSKEITDKKSEAYALTHLGGFNSALGENQKALEYYQKALPLINEIGDKISEAYTLNGLGGIYSILGEKRKALEYYQKALLLFKEIGDKVGETKTLNNFGTVYAELGENQKAIEFFEKSLPLRKEVGDKAGEAVTLNNLGLVYSNLGEKQKALEYYEKSLLLRIEVGDKKGEATTLDNFGSVYTALGENQIALGYYEKALLLTKEVGNKLGEATTLNNLGGVYSALREKQKAIEFYEKALPVFRQIGNKSGEARTLTNLGLLYSNLRENQKAIEFYEKALPVFNEVKDKSGEAKTLGNLMSFWGRLGNSKLAITYGKQSVNLYQNLRSNIRTLDSATQKNFLNSVDYTYRYLVEILLENGRFSEAQKILNLFKDQQFFDPNPNPNKPIKQAVLSNREALFASQYRQTIDEVGKLSSQLSELKRTIDNRQKTSDESANLQKLENQLTSATDSFLNVLKNAETEFAKPFDDNDKVGITADTQEMQSALKLLNQQTKKKTVAVYTLVGQRNFWALIVSEDSIKAVSFPIKDTELNDKALKLWGLLQSDIYNPIVLSKQLYDVVFKPLEKELPNDTKTIMWSLDGNLRYLPMSVLFDGKQFLVERFNHVVFTRADSQRILKSLNPNWSGLGFGTSKALTVRHLGNNIPFKELPGVTQELTDIFKPLNPQKGLLNGQVLADEKFTKDNFLEALKAKRPVVHIASHFAFRPGDEERSFLLMGDGTAFSLGDMKKETALFEGVDLLALSACNTAATQQDANGREVDGFAELAQRLGSGAVMATLWSVADNSTPWLMKDFYNLKLNKGENKAEALRKAQLSLLKGKAKVNPLIKREDLSPIKIEIVENKEENPTKTRDIDVIYLDKKDAPVWDKKKRPPFSHPFYWSPFILFGNWK